VLIGAANGEVEAQPACVTLAQRVAEIMREQNVDQKAALKQAAREAGITKREAYQKFLRERD
jgi:hypothetical protein